MWFSVSSTGDRTQGESSRALELRALVRERGPVAAVAFGAVGRRVGALQELVGGLSAAGAAQSGDADADGQPDAAHDELADGVADAVGEEGGTRQGRVRQDHEELVATVARGD